MLCFQLGEIDMKLKGKVVFENEIGTNLPRFCVLNILTGVFVDNANKLVEKDEGHMKFAEMEAKDLFIKQLHNRFNEMERKVQKDRKNLKDMSLKEMDRYWEKSKKKNEEQ